MGSYTGSLCRFGANRCFLVQLVCWLALLIEQVISVTGWLHIISKVLTARSHWDISLIAHFKFVQNEFQITQTGEEINLKLQDNMTLTCEEILVMRRGMNTQSTHTQHLSLTNPLLLINVQGCWSFRWEWFVPWPCSCWSSWGRPHKSAWPVSSGQLAGGLPPLCPPLPSPPSALVSLTGASDQNEWL